MKEISSTGCRENLKRAIKLYKWEIPSYRIKNSNNKCYKVLIILTIIIKKSNQTCIRQLNSTRSFKMLILSQSQSNKI